MAVFYALNIAAAVALMFWPYWFSRRVLRLTPMNPLTIAMAVALPVEVFKLLGGPSVLLTDGLSDSSYQYAVLMGNLQVASQIVGLMFFYQLFQMSRLDRYLPLKRTVLAPRDLNRASQFFLGLFAVSYLLLTTGEYGLVGWLTNPREGYQLNRTGSGQWYALATTFLGVAYLLSFLAKPTPRRALLATAVYVFISYFLGSKQTMLAIFTSGVIFLWFLRWRYLGRVLVLGTPVILSLLLVNLFLAMSEEFGVLRVLGYFDHYNNAATYYRAYFADEIPLFHGEVFSSNVWAYVPRAIWPDKPFVYGVILVNEYFFPGQAELTNTPAFGGAVEQFADFGWPGVILFGLFSSQSILIAMFSYLTFRRPGVELRRVTLATVLLLTVQFAPMFGSYFPGGLYVMLLFIVLALVRLCKRRGRRRSKSRSSLPALPAVAASHPQASPQ